MSPYDLLLVWLIVACCACVLSFCVRVLDRLP